MGKAKQVFMFEYKRGNHAVEHVYNYGKKIMQGNACAVRKEYRDMVNFCRRMYYSSNTTLSKKEYVNYEMGDIFLIEKDGDGNIKWFYV